MPEEEFADEWFEWWAAFADTHWPKPNSTDMALVLMASRIMTKAVLEHPEWLVAIARKLDESNGDVVGKTLQKLVERLPVEELAT